MLEDKIREIIKQQKLERRLGDKRAEQFWEKIKALGGVAEHAATHSLGGSDVVNHDDLAGFVAAEHKSLPNTIAEVLSNHDKALHEALGLAPVATPIFTGQVTAPTVDLTGGQIAFPAGQQASADVNTLDDYEEGTWTPTITNNSSYTIQYGTYTKIGRIVLLYGKIEAIVTQDATCMVISGLPFVGLDTSDRKQRTSALIMGDWIGMGTVMASARLRINGSTLQSIKDNAGSSVYLTHNDLATTIQVGFGLWYYTAT